MSRIERRLPAGGHIDRTKLIRFRFNGRSYLGIEGDTLASALLANGVSLTARGFKYHRPRGIMGAAYEEPGSFVQLAGEHEGGSEAITTVPLFEGLDARSVNCWPSPTVDLMASAQLFARLLPAGFYYKTFMWPDWRLFEPLIRHAAGLTTAPRATPPEGAYEIRHTYCDVLVVGAGPAGLMAALAAARSEARVMLVDDGVEPGGSLLSGAERIDGGEAAEWVGHIVRELDSTANVLRLADASAWGYREHNLVMVTERRSRAIDLRQRTWRVRAGRVVLATGAIERMLVFENNDRPGVMLASAARAYVNRYAVRPGRRAVVFTNNDSAYAAARALRDGGIEVAAIVDSRPRADIRAAAPAETRIMAGHVVAAAGGFRRVKFARVRPAGGGAAERIACDLLCVSGGWSPAVHLFSQSRGRLRYDDAIAAFRPDKPAQATLCAGAADGTFGVRRAIESGATAGSEAARRAGFRPTAVEIPAVVPEDPYAIQPLWFVEPDSPSAKTFVDIQNDVTLADVRLALREGFGAIEHAKRYTTAGMGIDQGKIGNLNVMGAIADATGVAPAQVGTTTFRSPYVPIEFGAIAGAREGSALLPYRHTPMTPWHKRYGAVMYEAGARWRRPGYYPRPGEAFADCVAREARAVRERVGVYDGSPLGKFEIQGPNALDLLETVYTNSFASLKLGEGRYGLMLSDDGLILDDGVTFRLGGDRYLMFTSTGQADTIHERLEEFAQFERPDWKVAITPVTSRWCNATVCGPLAREVLKALGADIDVSNDSFPFMSFREARVVGFPARLCRVSFTGELSFEINVPARHGLSLWERVMEAGEPFGIEPVGSEANHVLRVEKGFLSTAHEADGTTDPHDLGMGWIVSKRKRDFIGKRAIEIRRSADAPRRELVGLLPDDPHRLLPEGAPLTPGGREERTEGFVTACVSSVARNRSVALALLVDGRARMGSKAHVRIKDEAVSATIVAPCFHDPAGERLRS